MPKIGPMKAYRLPSRQEWRMQNGLRVVLVEDKRPLVTAELVFPVGAAAFPAERAGLVEAMAELMTDGTERLTSLQVAETADSYGGYISCEADGDSVSLGAGGLASKLDEILSLMAEVARSPSFPEDEVGLRRVNMLDELKAARAEPSFLADVAFRKRLFSGHPYAVTAPTEKSIALINRETVRQAYRSLIAPREAVFVLVGDVQAEALKAALERHFGSWEGAASAGRASEAPTRVDQRRVYLVDRPGSSQVTLVLGNRSAREFDPDYFDLLVANQALGGSFASRLVQDVRETKGYTYSIGSRLQHQAAASWFAVSTPLRSEVMGPALDLILKHVQDLRSKPLAQAELEKAKSYLAGSFARRMETQAGLLGAVVRMKLHGLPSDFYDGYVERVQAVGLEGARRAAQIHMRPEELVLVAVGDQKTIRDGLARFSAEPVADLNEDGDPVAR
jgi:zinc protease